MNPPTLEQGCMNKLMWRWDLPESLDPHTLKEELLKKQYKDLTKFETVVVLESLSEHKIIIIPRTRRLQIRLHYITPQDDRPSVATEVAMELYDCYQAYLNRT